MPGDIAEALARRLGIGRERVLSVCELLDAGFHPIFVAHYRKAVTGGMDEAAIWRLLEARQELATLEDLRQRGRRIAEAAGALTNDLLRHLDEAEDAETIEDHIRPLRPRRRTAGLVAQQRGLGPLAEYLRTGPADGPDLATKAAEFVNPAMEVRSPDEALAGAGHILAEQVAEDPRVRIATRQLVWEKGVLKTEQSKEGCKASPEFRAYFQFQEPLAHIPPHRVLAVNRGERNKVLKVSIEAPLDVIKEKVLEFLVPKDHRFRPLMEVVVSDALTRLVLPAIEREVRRQLTDRAETHAIEVFAANLRSLLMARPVRGQRVLAIQPGYRTGSKVAVLDETGTLLGENIIYPLEPQKKWGESKAALTEEIRRHGVTCVAIGNGTGCREIEALVSELIEENGLAVEYAVVSEAGAAVYADSESGKQEFPNLEAALRATISIGRRLQDPLAELVKVDPRAIGVGLYQHDVNQVRLQKALEYTVESCVAAVGADANSASLPVLRRVPGLTEAQAAALVERRKAATLTSRDELKTIPGWDDKTFTMAAGFLRVKGPRALDATRVHPENYAVAERLLARLGHQPEDLFNPDMVAVIRRDLTGLALEPLAAELGVPVITLADIITALQHPDYDPRMQHHGPVFRRKMRKIEDLRPGQWVKGTVRNVVDFGAFVDIGLKEDGLIHISQFSRRYVRNPLKFLHVGDVVDVRIVSVEPEKHRIALTLIPESPPKKTEGSPPRRRPPGAGEGEPVAAAVGADGSVASDRAQRRDGQADRRPRRQPPSPDHRPAADAQATSANGLPQQARAPGRRQRRPRSGKPRVIVSRSQPVQDNRGTDEAGRPRIRWAYYESDPPDDEYDETPATPASHVGAQADIAAQTPARSPAPDESAAGNPLPQTGTTNAAPSQASDPPPPGQSDTPAP